jgi:hypothetical protein
VKCPHSRRGHTWRELGCAPNATGIIDHARRLCAKCGVQGYVNGQGVIIFGEQLENSGFAWAR